MNDHDLLIEIHAQLTALTEEFRRVSNGTGFPRCAERLPRIKALEEEVKNLKAKLWWSYGLALTTLLGLVISFVKGGIID